MMDNLKCFACGGKGHIERQCPNTAIAADSNPSDKPLWCHNCDRRTRLVMTGDVCRRCPNCHPLSHLPLVQHIRCPGCHMVVYSWDINECGQHSSPVTPFDVLDTRPEREEIALIIAGETKRHRDSDDAA
jgi:Zinc knuckle